MNVSMSVHTKEYTIVSLHGYINNVSDFEFHYQICSFATYFLISFLAVLRKLHCLMAFGALFHNLVESHFSEFVFEPGSTNLPFEQARVVILSSPTFILCNPTLLPVKISFAYQKLGFKILIVTLTSKRVTLSRSLLIYIECKHIQ